MKIVQPYAHIHTTSNSQAHILPFIEYAARISHRSEDDQKEDSAERFLRAVVIDHGDWSVVEHVSVSVEILTDRGITHEIVRHRLASYTQESTRFVNYAKKMPPSFIYPIPGVECLPCLSGNEPRFHRPHERDSSYDNGLDEGWYHIDHDTSEYNHSCSYFSTWLKSIQDAENSYRILLEKGWRPQEARSVFPNALASKILVTMNLRSWRQILLMRTTKEAHPQMRQIMIPLLEEFKKMIPVLFEDIEPNARQVDNIKKGR